MKYFYFDKQKKMKNFHTKLKNHGKKVIIHLKRHHRKYLFGAFWWFAIFKLAMLGLWAIGVVHNTSNTYASNTDCWTQYWWAPTETRATGVAYECDGNIPVISIYSWNMWITMKAMNEWAIAIWTWCSATDTWACGYHYQRWNNHWFLPGENNSAAFPWWESTWATQVTNCADYWPTNRYSWSTFIYNYSNWCNPSNDNLRWWSGDSQDNNRWYDEENNVATNVENRQWPCDTWYHVPSIWEWNQVLEYWAEENEIELEDDGGLKYNYTTLDWLKFQEDFKIPFAGSRYYYDAKVFSMGSYAYLWSSSPRVGNDYARRFYLGPDGAHVNGSYDRADADSLRCFKDSYLGFPSAASQVAFWTGEVEGEPACSGEVLSWEVVSWDLLACVESLSKQYYILSGWRDDEADARRNTWDVVTTGLNLRAVWKPDTDANGNWIADEEESFVITREDGDGNFVWSGEFEYGTDPVFGGTEPEKTGYTFSWWSPAVENVTGDFTYFATWTVNQYTITFNTDWWTAIDPITADFGSDITVPADPTKEWYTFAGWDVEIPTTIPAEDITITAIWTANPTPSPGWDDRIDNVVPTCDISYSTTWATTWNVVATLTDCSEEITVTNNSGNTWYTFENTWTFTFEFQDLAGNTWEATATVDRIDKVKPTCDIIYSTTWATTWNVIATLTGCSKEITWTDTQHTFTWNWTYTFNFQDLLGNTGSTDAIVTWIISWDNTTYFDTEWNKFIWNDLTICNPNTSRECITMMDRNLWATTNDISKTWSYWYHYQWWNNHGFSIWSGCRSTMSQCSDEVTYNAVIGQTNADGFWPDMPYSSGVFYKWHIDWTSGINYNLRWWSGDSANNNYWYDIINKVATNMIWRQWPCPEWYHIPSMWERFKLLEYWKLDNNITGFNNYSLYSSIVVRKFQEDFKIPFAGVRYYENAKTWAVWQKAYLWSSSPSYVDNMIHIQSSSISFWVHSGAYGESIRCFKNSSNTWNTFSISFDNDINPWEYTTFTVRAMKDWISYSNYTGTVIFTLSNKDWGLINKKNYTFSNSWRYTFEASDLWRKTFYSWLKINEEWTYVLEVNWLNDGFKWSTTINVWKSHSSAEFKYDTLKFNPYYSDEMNEAYQYARYFDITTKDSIKEADMYSGLNRIAMAKMLANYAENVLWEDNFDTDRDCTFKDVSTSLDKQYDYWVTKACQLWIMWVNMPNNKFYPNWWVTRKEFATALSRLLYWTKDGAVNYYSTHITKLKREWIITNTDPDLWELRWYVMLMLKRVAENSD